MAKPNFDNDFKPVVNPVDLPKDPGTVKLGDKTIEKNPIDEVLEEDKHGQKEEFWVENSAGNVLHPPTPVKDSNEQEGVTHWDDDGVPINVHHD